MKKMIAMTLLGVRNMKSYRAAILCLSVFLLPAMASAQENVSDKIQDGEVGYTVGCSLAASLNIPACGELPSGRKAMTAASPVEDASSGEDNQADDQDASNQSSDDQPEFQQEMQDLSNATLNRMMITPPRLRSPQGARSQYIAPAPCHNYCNK
jgi:hypothetical protein